MKRIAVITGASSGLGKAFTQQVSQNYNFDEIWILARREDKLRELAEQINAKGNFKTVRPVVMDVSGRQGAEAFKAYLEEEDKKLRAIESGIEIGLLINNAGFGTYGPFEETSVNREMDMIDLNCTGLTGMCGVALPYLKKGSVIINTSSLAAFMPLGNFAVYGASKAYVLSFSIALAAELKDKGIKVCALCPGSVSTEFANVASNGARKEVKGGIEPDKVVAQCLKRAFKGKKISMYRPKWRFTAFMSRLVGRYLVARYTYKYNKRPHNPDEDMKKSDGEVSISDFM
ncbi:MAG: SDR family NAD(P)-dependent oxidoreductase [Treponema sp.]|nr:SDR family NAD(P)-dependent oxidoreductase [Treponema sp.]